MDDCSAFFAPEAEMDKLISSSTPSQSQKLLPSYNNQNLTIMLPDRLKSLVLDLEDLQNRETLTKWITEFLPKPQPPKFFRPLCSRLSRQNKVMNEKQSAYISATNKKLSEARKRFNMSIRQARDEQKAFLRRKSENEIAMKQHHHLDKRLKVMKWNTTNSSSRNKNTCQQYHHTTHLSKFNSFEQDQQNWKEVIITRED